MAEFATSQVKGLAVRRWKLPSFLPLQSAITKSDNLRPGKTVF